MNVKDRERMDDFGDKINHLDKKVQRISDALLDDERTSKIGTISKVEQIEKDMEILLSAYRIGKWMIISLLTTLLAVLGTGFKSYWLDK
tara:strand:+ start:197 stop:463 length:267 start_codon:yes stop_codon:yes gene_type:complete